MAYLAGLQVELDGNVFHYRGKNLSLEGLTAMLAQVRLQLARCYIIDMVVYGLQAAVFA